jgi:hypothetical protein
VRNSVKAKDITIFSYNIIYFIWIAPVGNYLALDKQIKKIKNPCSILSGLPFLTHYVIMNHGFLSQPQMAYELLFFVVVLFYVCFIFGGTGV